MNPCDWVVCERGNRWAAALRSAANHQFTKRDSISAHPLSARDRERRLKTAFGHWLPPRLREVRSLAELEQRFAVRPNSFAMVEVHPENLGSALAWLADAGRRYPSGRFAALLDTLLLTPQENIQDAADALREAGACLVALSPRRLQHVLAVAAIHGAEVAMRTTPAKSDLSLVEWAWSRLPWQDS